MNIKERIVTSINESVMEENDFNFSKKFNSFQSVSNSLKSKFSNKLNNEILSYFKRQPIKNLGSEDNSNYFNFDLDYYENEDDFEGEKEIRAEIVKTQSDSIIQKNENITNATLELVNLNEINRTEDEVIDYVVQLQNQKLQKNWNLSLDFLCTRDNSGSYSIDKVLDSNDVEMEVSSNFKNRNEINMYNDTVINTSNNYEIEDFTMNLEEVKSFNVKMANKFVMNQAAGNELIENSPITDVSFLSSISSSPTPSISILNSNLSNSNHQHSPYSPSSSTSPQIYQTTSTHYLNQSIFGNSNNSNNEGGDTMPSSEDELTDEELKNSPMEDCLNSNLVKIKKKKSYFDYFLNHSNGLSCLPLNESDELENTENIDKVNTLPSKKSFFNKNKITIKEKFFNFIHPSFSKLFTLNSKLYKEDSESVNNFPLEMQINFFLRELVKYCCSLSLEGNIKIFFENKCKVHSINFDSNTLEELFNFQLISSKDSDLLYENNIYDEVKISNGTKKNEMDELDIKINNSLKYSNKINEENKINSLSYKIDDHEDVMNKYQGYYEVNHKINNLENYESLIDNNTLILKSRSDENNDKNISNNSQIEVKIDFDNSSRVVLNDENDLNKLNINNESVNIKLISPNYYNKVEIFFNEENNRDIKIEIENISDSCDFDAQIVINDNREDKNNYKNEDTIDSEIFNYTEDYTKTEKNNLTSNTSQIKDFKFDYEQTEFLGNHLVEEINQGILFLKESMISFQIIKNSNEDKKKKIIYTKYFSDNPNSLLFEAFLSFTIKI